MQLPTKSMEPATLKICIIGTGFSGLCAAVQLQRKLKLTNFTVYEANSEVGGNWLVNTYPGCACDIQSHLYSYSFAPKSDWTKEFAAQAEILDYMKSVARKYNIYKYTKFRHQVKRLTWLESESQWNVLVLNMETNVEEALRYDIIINGSGELRLPEVPEEFKAFRGPTIHSARWDERVELDGKTVAVIGSGATAIQLIPSIANKVGKLLAYQRKPAWVIPSFQSKFSSVTKLAFAHVPGLRAAYRSSLFLSNEFLFPVFETGTLASKIANPIAVGLGKHHLKQQVRRDPDLRKQLLPNYRFGCKRVGISNKYYPALNLPHVSVITSKITRVNEDSIETEDGKVEKIDVLILATGFRVHDYFAPMEIIGRNSVNILAKWKQSGPSCYFGITSSSMPNKFLLMGPGSDVNHNSAVFQIECQTKWIVKILKEMLRRRAKSVSVLGAAEEKYMTKLQNDMIKTVYGNYECGSWFTDSRGKITTLYPKNSISYWNQTRRVDFSKFDFI